MRSKRSIQQHKQLNKQLGIIAGILFGAAVLVWVAAAVAINAQKPTVVAEPEVYTIEEPEVEEPVIQPSGIYVPRRTNGELADANDANSQPIAVMIENAAFGGVRPQFGLSRAEIVYEIMVEGGITRFMAIYSGSDLPEKIGPVRSARPTYLEFVSEYDALYAHAGGSPEALAAISGLSIKDLNALEAGGPYFFRDNARTAPHNLFTSVDLLVSAVNSQQLQTETSTFDSWDFIDPVHATTEEDDDAVNDEDSGIEIIDTTEVTDAGDSTNDITIDFGSGPLYTVEYTYDPITKTYARFNGGERQTDANTKEALAVDTVIVQKVEAGVEVGESRINFNVNGSGEVLVFHSGKVFTGTWNKTSRTERTEFIDEEGNAIALAPGQIWISFVPPSGSITYQ